MDEGRGYGDASVVARAATGRIVGTHVPQGQRRRRGDYDLTRSYYLTHGSRSLHPTQDDAYFRSVLFH